MAKTYLEILNIALRDINEVPLTEASFLAPRGLQATAKEYVNRAYADVLNYSKEWPFLNTNNLTLLTIDTVKGQQEYSLDPSLDHVDWDSFYIKSDDGEVSQPITALNEDYYTQHVKSHDDTQGIPKFVYRRKDNASVGLTPIPEKDGWHVTFAGWIEPTLLINSTDQLIIPDRYYNVLVARIRYYLWMFRENAQQASFSLNEYEDGIKQMHRDLVEKQAVRMRAV